MGRIKKKIKNEREKGRRRRRRNNKRRKKEEPRETIDCRAL